MFLLKLMLLDLKMDHLDTPRHGRARAMQLMHSKLDRIEKAAEKEIKDNVRSMTVEGEVVMHSVKYLAQSNKNALRRYSICKVYKKEVLRALGPKG